MLTTKFGKTIYYHGRISGLYYKDIQARLHEIVVHLSNMGYEVTHPFIGFTDLAPKLGRLYLKDMYQNSRLSDKAAFERSKWLVRAADIVLIDLSSNPPQELPRPAVGAITALVWGNVYDKHTLAIVEDDGLYDHAFIRQSANIVFKTMEDASHYLSELSVLNVSH